MPKGQSRPLKYQAISPDVVDRDHLLTADDSDWSWRTRVRLREGRPLQPGEWPVPPPVFRYKQLAAMNDLPCALDNMFIVSDRLRSFFEAEAPGVAEYLPVRVEGPGSKSLGRYWAMTWVRTFDCLDEEASMNVDDTGHRYVEVPVIGPSWIPPDGVLGLLGGYTVERLIRDDLRRKITKAGFEGFEYYHIAHTGTPAATNFVKPDHTKRKQARTRRKP